MKPPSSPPVVPNGSPSGWLSIGRVLDEALDPVALETAVFHSGAGASVSFVGRVRDHNRGRPVLRLEYEAYRPMAESVLQRIGDEVAKAWPGARCAIHHRVGLLQIGDAAVAIAVSAGHREEAFAGCRHAIERLKQDAPIWKREVYPEGEDWVSLGP